MGLAFCKVATQLAKQEINILQAKQRIVSTEENASAVIHRWVF